MSLNQKLLQAVDALKKGQLDEAEPLYRDILKVMPHDPVILQHMGIIHINRQDFDNAVLSIRQSLTFDNTSSEAYGNLGLALVGQGKLDEAIAAYNQAIQLNPQNAHTYNNLCSALLAQKKPVEAIEACRKAIACNPDFAIAHYNLGVAWQQQGKFNEAIASFQNAINSLPNFPEAYTNMGLALMSLGRPDEAIVAYRKAIEIRPDFAEAYNNLGQPLNDQRKLEEATEAYQHAVELKPNFTGALNNLVTILRKRGMIDEAIEKCRGGIAADPTNTKARIELPNLRRQICDWTDYETDTQTLLALVDDVEPFIFLSVLSTPAHQLQCAQKWASKLSRGISFRHDAPRTPGRIRIGYLSADFRRHATAYLMAELFERHDRSRFEIFGYSYGYDDESDVRQRLVAAFDHFIDLQHTPHVAAAQRIYDDKIDILVDLKGYTGDTRTDILVNRPAPIQVNYVGYPGTMGADFIDYIIGDSFVTPLDQQPFFSERIVQLPHSYQPNDTKRQIDERIPTRELYGLPEQGLVFCSFNGSYKITPVFFDVWMRLLKAVPGSVLWLLAVNPSTEQNLRREAAARGVGPERLIFAQGMPLPLHLARHRLADLFLDTLPICAHTTASDSLWAGLPVLTCAGNCFVGRVAGSLLQAVGLPELITHSVEEYEAMALDLGTHPEKLVALKEKLKRNLPTAPLFNIEYYTRGLEAAYNRMWEIRQAGEAPKTIVVQG